MMYPKRSDGLMLVALCLLAFMLFNVMRDRGVVRSAQAAAPSNPLPVATGLPVATPMPVVALPLMLTQPQDAVTEAPSIAVATETDPRAFASPYDDFELTQGPHGSSYGHLAIDIAAGNGALIKAPISGTITELYVDEWGNTTLVIENDVYQVMFLHGLYTVNLGDQVNMGDPLGTESNQGNTYDAYGQSCRGRDCGYHTHLNVFDKILGTNVNPLNLIELP